MTFFGGRNLPIPRLSSKLCKHIKILQTKPETSQITFVSIAGIDAFANSTFHLITYLL